MQQRRSEKRFNWRLNARLQVRCNIRGTSRFDNGVTSDISPSGISFTHDAYISPQTPVNLQLQVSDRLIQTVGKIVWSSPVPHSNRYRLGAEFLELGVAEKEYLEDFVHLKSPKF